MKFFNKLTLCLMGALPWHVASAQALTESVASVASTDSAALQMATSMVNAVVTDHFPLAQMCGAFLAYLLLAYLCGTILSQVRAKRRQLCAVKAVL